MIFKLPQRDFSNVKERLNFKLAWNIANLTFGITVLSCLLFFFFDKTLFGFTVISVAISITFVALLKFVRDYHKVAFFYALTATILFNSLMIRVLDVLHLVEYIWLFVTVIYAYALCGKKLGNIILILNVIGISIHIVFTLQNNLSIIHDTINGYHIFTTTLTVIAGFVAFGYIVNVQLINMNNIELNLTSSNQSLTDKNQLIQKQNEEKEIMMKEIHHRVKNNLQIISSLLRIHANQLDNEEAEKALKENVNRISSIALIHEMIYEGNDLIQMDYNPYITLLTKEIISNFNPSNTIDFEIQTNELNIGNRTLVPIALIFNELITNSVKHAFTEVEQPKIKIYLHSSEKNDLLLKYSDNGTWKKTRESDSLGLELIDIFTEQLNGTMERLTSNEGTTYNFNLFIID